MDILARFLDQCMHICFIEGWEILINLSFKLDIFARYFYQCMHMPFIDGSGILIHLSFKLDILARFFDQCMYLRFLGVQKCWYSIFLIGDFSKIFRSIHAHAFLDGPEILIPPSKWRFKMDENLHLIQFISRTGSLIPDFFCIKTFRHL